MLQRSSTDVSKRLVEPMLKASWGVCKIIDSFWSPLNAHLSTDGLLGFPFPRSKEVVLCTAHMDVGFLSVSPVASTWLIGPLPYCWFHVGFVGFLLKPRAPSILLVSCRLRRFPFETIPKSVPQGFCPDTSRFTCRTSLAVFGLFPPAWKPNRGSLHPVSPLNPWGGGSFSPNAWAGVSLSLGFPDTWAISQVTIDGKKIRTQGKNASFGVPNSERSGNGPLETLKKGCLNTPSKRRPTNHYQPLKQTLQQPIKKAIVVRNQTRPPHLETGRSPPELEFEVGLGSRRTTCRDFGVETPWCCLL